MLYLYDKVIVDKFKKLFNDNRISIQPPENAIRYTAQLEDDNVNFPLISLNRTNWSIRGSDVNFAQSRTGVLNRVNDNGTLSVMKILPIRLDYQLDVYTVDKLSNDEIYRELLFYFLNNPTLTVNIPYTLDTEHVFNLYFNDDIIDNSDTVEHVNRGVLYIYTSTWYSNDAYLYDGPTELNRVPVSHIELNNDN